MAEQAFHREQPRTVLPVYGVGKPPAAVRYRKKRNSRDFLADIDARRVFSNVLMMTDSQQLLADYARNGSEAAFRELVTLYTDLVYSTALRLVGRDAHRAQDVAQRVFIDLARQAAKLYRDSQLG